MPALDENKKLYLRLADEVLTKKNLALVDELIAPDFREHVGGEVRRVGVEGFKAARLRRNAAFPDWKVTIDDIIAEGDKVVARATGQGTHLGEYMGIPPTGRRIKVSWIAIYRIADGKLAEHWQQIDELGLPATRRRPDAACDLTARAAVFRFQGKNRSSARSVQGLSLRSDRRLMSVVLTRQPTRSHSNEQGRR
jgi:predicted ester cyclase